MITDFMASARQIAWRKKFAKLYGKKKKGAKSTKIKGDIKGYVVSSPRVPDGRIYATYKEALTASRKLAGGGVAGFRKSTKGLKYHSRGKYWS